MERFTYFSDIEEHYQRRRGSILPSSPVDWCLMETWKEAGIPLEAVLRGIDAAFDKWERRSKKTRKVNSLAYCQQEVLAAMEELQEAALGSTRDPSATSIANEDLARYFERNAQQMEKTRHPSAEVRTLVDEQAATLKEQAAELVRIPLKPTTGLPGTPGLNGPPADLEALERRMTVMEEKLFAALWSHASDEELMEARAQAERELAPYRGKMSAAQIEQLLRQYGNKRLLERHGLPRLSLFYL
ncbi:MAG: hypothetical protein WA532_15245 [Candidatus Korobacteraceae bacterium]